MAYNSVAQISQQMVARIGVENFNFNELGIYSYYDANESEEALSSRYDGILASVGANDVIIFQTPTWNTNEWEVGLFNRTFVYENVKRIIFIHDVIPLMFESNYYLLDRFIDMYAITANARLPAGTWLNNQENFNPTHVGSRLPD